jgi:uncharacterized membrane protein YgdD (TMEM256/DUF423 family)
MRKSYIIISAIIGALGVALGAFGAHGLQDIISEKMLQTYKTGIFYHLIHAVVLLSLSVNSKYEFRLPFYLFTSGILLFSFSLYLYTLTNLKIFAMITPVGGILLIFAWMSIISAVIRRK